MPPTSLWQENDNSLCLITKPAIANFISLRILSSLGVEKKKTLFTFTYPTDVTYSSPVLSARGRVRQETFYELMANLGHTVCAGPV